MPTSATADRLRIIAAAILFSTGGAAIKATALTGWQVASFRSGLAAIAVFLFVPEARRHWNWKVLAVSVVYAATMVLFVVSNKATTAANAIFLQSTAPLYILLLAPWLLKERSRRADFVTMAALIVGLLLVVAGLPPTAATAPDPVVGNVLALASGVTWAMTLMGLRWLSAAEDGDRASMTTVVGGNAIACLVCLPAALPLASVAPADIAVVSYLGLVQIALAYVFMTRGIRGVPAVEASMLLLLEPALNPVWAWLVHGEEPGALPLLGGLVILVAMVIRARQGADVRRPAAD